MKKPTVFFFFSLFNLLPSCNNAFGQFNNNTWYLLYETEIASVTLTQKYLSTSVVRNYNSDRQYTSRTDSFSIRKRVTKNDSTCWVYSFPQPDRFDNSDAPLLCHPFVYHKNSNTCSIGLVLRDTVVAAWLTAYTAADVQKMLAWPRLKNQSRDTLIAVYGRLAARWRSFRQLPRETQMVCAALGAGFEAAIESPEYVNSKLCPLHPKEDPDGIAIREKAENGHDNGLLGALDNYEQSKKIQR